MRTARAAAQDVVDAVDGAARHAAAAQQLPSLTARASAGASTALTRGLRAARSRRRESLALPSRAAAAVARPGGRLALSRGAPDRPVSPVAPPPAADWWQRRWGLPRAAPRHSRGDGRRRRSSVSTSSGKTGLTVSGTARVTSEV